MSGAEAYAYELWAGTTRRPCHQAPTTSAAASTNSTVIVFRAVAKAAAAGVPAAIREA